MKLTKFVWTTMITITLAGCGSLQNVRYDWCNEQPEVINLSADALFHFDKSGVKDLLPKGKQELDALAAKLTNNYVTVKAIKLTGYTDRLGSDAYNQHLSQARANTVKTYLESKGVAVPMQAIGGGKYRPGQVCARLKGKELRACLQPDRRVVVEITGAKKAD